MVPGAGEETEDTVLLTKAADINSSGCIVGQGDFKVGRVPDRKAYLLRPVDTSLANENLVPAARIVTPSDGTRARVGDEIAVTADVFGSDAPVLLLAIRKPI